MAIRDSGGTHIAQSNRRCRMSAPIKRTRDITQGHRATRKHTKAERRRTNGMSASAVSPILICAPPLLSARLRRALHQKPLVNISTGGLRTGDCPFRIRCDKKTFHPLPKRSPGVTTPTKKKVIRLFQGIAGSPLSVIADPSSIPVQRPKRGRPRKFANEAEKKRHYRAVKSEERTERQKLVDIEAQLPKMTDGICREEITGGFDGEKLAYCDYKHLERLKGRKVSPKGRGSSEDHINGQDGRAIKDEREGKFQFDPKFKIQLNWKLSKEEKEHIVAEFVSLNLELTDDERDLRCKICAFVIKGYLLTGVAHFEEKHKKLLREEIRMNRPRPTPKKKEVLTPFGNIGTAYLKSGGQS
jgi:hypothetical protein